MTDATSAAMTSPERAVEPLQDVRRVGDQAYEAIHAAIMNGSLPIGTRLQIRGLAEQLGISPMPVREAIKRLTEVGLVESIPYRGAVVKRFTQQELLDLYSVRRVLEIEATARAGEHFSTASPDRLRETFTKMGHAVGAGDVEEYLRLDELFLRELYAGARNPMLTEIIETLWQRCRAYKAVGARRALEIGKADLLTRYQGQLLDAVTTMDVALAVRATADSLDAAMFRIREVLPEDMFAPPRPASQGDL